MRHAECSDRMTLCAMFGSLLVSVCLLFANFYVKIIFFQLFLSVKPSECRIQIRIDILSVLIWVQTVCKGYQQTQKSPLSREQLRAAQSRLALLDQALRL